MRKVLFFAFGILLLAAWAIFYSWSFLGVDDSGSDWQLIKPVATSNSMHRIEIDLRPSLDSQVLGESQQQSPATSALCLVSSYQGNELPANQTVTSNGSMLFMQELRQTQSFRYRPQLVALRFDRTGKTLRGSACLKNSWWHDHCDESTDDRPIEPQLAADPGSKLFSGAVYCVWADGNREEMQQVFIAVSIDQGKNWSQPAILSSKFQSGKSSMATMPSVAVNNQGIVGVCWYERCETHGDDSLQAENQPTANDWDLHFRASLDGGKTWLPNSLVNEDSDHCHVDIKHAKRLSSTPEGRFQTTLIRKNGGTSQLQTAAVEINVVK